MDGGASGDFISAKVVEKLELPVKPIKGVELAFANGQKEVCNKIVQIYLRLQDHVEMVKLRVAALPRHDIILGKPWLERWNPDIDWRRNEITMRKDGEEVLLASNRRRKAEDQHTEKRNAKGEKTSLSETSEGC